MMVSDWIIGMWTIAATLRIAIGCLLYALGENNEEYNAAIKDILVGGSMAFLSAMHYSGM